MSAPFTCSLNAEKSGLETTAAISLLMILVTKEVTTEPKAAPMTTATARSMTLPRMMNCLNPLSMSPLLSGGIIQKQSAVSNPPSACADFLRGASYSRAAWQRIDISRSARDFGDGLNIDPGFSGELQ